MSFPPTLYVEIRNAEGDLFYSASPNINDHAEVGNKIKIGVYQLVELQEVEFQLTSRKVEG